MNRNPLSPRALMAWLLRPTDYRACIYPLGFMALIFVLSSIPDTFEEDYLFGQLFVYVPPTVQNLLHVPLYAVLAVLWARALRAWPMASHALFVAACTLAIGYGILDEWHQSFVPGRYSTATDALLNALGAVLGTWAYLYVLNHPRRVASDLP